MYDLLVVESPAKAKSISTMLGGNWRVVASFGHVRDLPPKDLGVSLDSFKPQYEKTERGARQLASIGRLAQEAKRVFLATDPDREGEAIAWHVADALRLPHAKALRVTYQEVTEKAIRAAIAKPRQIDMNLVHAQEARRVLDRLVGYTVSPKLWEHAKGLRLSAGRVQTPALRLVVEREREIRNFKSVDHFGAVLAFSKPGEFEAEWITKPFIKDPKRPYILDRALAEEAAAVRKVVVLAVDTKPQSKSPPPPLTTSTLQQEASAKLGFSPSRTMELAQSLFETHHAITYHRTDSVTLSDEALQTIRAYAKGKGYPLPAMARQHATKSRNAQEAHEAIRPTEVSDEKPTGLNRDELALYELIHRRAVQSQLADLQTAVTTIVLGSHPDRRFQYGAKAVRVVAPGWTVLGSRPDESNLPEVKQGQQLEADDGEVKEKRTEPPKRYTEATLIQALEKLGIGRPSTYAAILGNITNREYIQVAKKAVVPTPIGESLIDALAEMRFAAYDYTATLEESLDQMAEGRAPYASVVGASWRDLQQDLESKIHAFKTPAGVAPSAPKTLGPATGSGGPKKAGTGSKSGKSAGAATGGRKKASPQAADTADTRACPECGKAMHVRSGPRGQFYGCTGFPSCRKTLPKT